MTLRSGRGRRARTVTSLGAAGVAVAVLTGVRVEFVDDRVGRLDGDPGRDGDRDAHGLGRLALGVPTPGQHGTGRPVTLRLRPDRGGRHVGLAVVGPAALARLRLGHGRVPSTGYIEFKNVSATSCTLYGFPGVSLLGGSPARQIGAAATRVPNSGPSLVTLAPSETASALLRIADTGNYSPATCHPVPATMLRVYPPNQTAPLTVRDSLPGCAAPSVKLLQISAVQPGTGNPPGATP